MSAQSDRFFDALFEEARQLVQRDDRSRQTPSLDQRVTAFLIAVHGHEGPFTLRQKAWARRAILRRIAILHVEGLSDQNNEQLDATVSKPRELVATSLVKGFNENVAVFIELIMPQAANPRRIGAAARHKAESSKERSAFILRWKQGDYHWRLEGRETSGGSDVRLRCEGGVVRPPKYIVWQNSVTQEVDRFEISGANERGFLVKMFLSRALKRIEAIGRVIHETDRTGRLPIVHFE